MRSSTTDRDKWVGKTARSHETQRLPHEGWRLAHEGWRLRHETSLGSRDGLDRELAVVISPAMLVPGLDPGVMTSLTQVSTGFEVRAIAPGVLAELRVSDDAGNAPVLTDADGAPLRCCLRRVRPGERVALVSYAPLRRWARETGAEPGPYDEVGPVFIHPAECDGPDGSGYPGSFATSARVLRAYNAGGRILGGRLVDPDAGGSPVPVESALAEMFADPAVALVHGRALEFGCFTFEVRRAGD
jgi:hypothetical protein